MRCFKFIQSLVIDELCSLVMNIPERMFLERMLSESSRESSLTQNNHLPMRKLLLRVSCACSIPSVGRFQEPPSIRYGDALHSDLSIRCRNIELVYSCKRLIDCIT